MECKARWISIPVIPPRFDPVPSRQGPPPGAASTRSVGEAPLGPSATPLAAPQLVLLVDDDPMARTPIARGLELGGYRVLEAGSGREALTIFLAEPGVDVVVTDTRMPGMSGTELIRRIRASRPAQAILRTSGMPDGDFPDDPPPTDIPFLPKPFLIVELQRRVGELARDGRA